MASVEHGCFFLASFRVNLISLGQRHATLEATCLSLIYGLQKTVLIAVSTSRAATCGYPGNGKSALSVSTPVVTTNTPHWQATCKNPQRMCIALLKSWKLKRSVLQENSVAAKRMQVGGASGFLAVGTSASRTSIIRYHLTTCLNFFMLMNGVSLCFKGFNVLLCFADSRNIV